MAFATLPTTDSEYWWSAAGAVRETKIMDSTHFALDPLCPSGLGFRVIAALCGLSPQYAYRVGRTTQKPRNLSVAGLLSRATGTRTPNNGARNRCVANYTMALCSRNGRILLALGWVVKRFLVFFVFFVFLAPEQGREKEERPGALRAYWRAAFFPLARCLSSAFHTEGCCCNWASSWAFMPSGSASCNPPSAVNNRGSQM